MCEERYETQIEWAGITIRICLTRNWLNGTAHHLEIRADEPLPITTTGYRSHFLPTDLEVDREDVVAFLNNWLETAAQSQEWQNHLERKRQGDLFGL